MNGFAQGEMQGVSVSQKFDSKQIYDILIKIIKLSAELKHGIQVIHMIRKVAEANEKLKNIVHKIASDRIRKGTANKEIDKFATYLDYRVTH